jgi:putative aminopeptidase FrvX
MALDAVTGLTLTSDNYKEAVAILKERFGNPQVLISAHMDSLFSVRKVKNKEDVKALRK